MTRQAAAPEAVEAFVERVLVQWLDDHPAAARERKESNGDWWGNEAIANDVTDFVMASTGVLAEALTRRIIAELDRLEPDGRVR